VVAIDTQTQNGPTWFGAGFIVGRPIIKDTGEKVYHTFLVTNKHVLNGKKTKNCQQGDARG